MQYTNTFEMARASPFDTEVRSHSADMCFCNVPTGVSIASLSDGISYAGGLWTAAKFARKSTKPQLPRNDYRPFS